MQILSGILNSLMILISLFLICLVLIQRGKGGGLAGAFGGMGGSSAFGTKAGDIFTRVTMTTAVIWILLSMILVVLYNQGGSRSAWVDGTPKTGAGKAKEVPPTAGGRTGKAKAPASSSAPKAVPGPAAPPSSSPSSSSSTTAPAPVSVPALPDDRSKSK